MECRSSGPTDYQWCLEHDIKPGTFYNWVKRFHQKGCPNILYAHNERNPMKQEVVKINFQEPPAPRLDTEPLSGSTPYAASVLSGISVIELFMSSAAVRLPQGTGAGFLEQVLQILGRISC